MLKKNIVPEQILKIKEVFEAIGKILTFFIGLSFTFGFLIWNVYLQRLSFISDDLFQMRFILSGALYILCILILLFIKIILYKIIDIIITFKKLNEKLNIFLLWVFIIFSIVFLIPYTYYLFPFINGSYGGGSPRVLAFLVNPEQIDYLKQFGVQLGKGSSIQTQISCIVYEDSNSYLVATDRIFSIKKQDIRGIVSLPSIESNIYKDMCVLIIRQYLDNNLNLRQ